MFFKGNIALDGTQEPYLFGGGKLLFRIRASSKNELFQKRDRYEKYLNQVSSLTGSIVDSPNSLIIPLLDKKAYLFAYEEDPALYVVYEIADFYVLRNPDIHNIVGMRFEDILLSILIGGSDDPKCRAIYWSFEHQKQPMKIGFDPYRAYRKKNRCSALLLRCDTENWNDFVSYYDSVSLFAGFCYFLADMDFKLVKFITKDGTPGHYYHLVPRSVWERAKQRREKILARPDCIPGEIFVHHISQVAATIFDGKIDETHYPSTHESDVIYAYEIASGFSAFESEFHSLYGDIDSLLLGKTWSNPVRDNITALMAKENDPAAKNFYGHCLQDLERPSSADRFRYFFAQEKELVHFVLKANFLDSIPQTKLIQTMARMRNDLMHGNSMDKPDKNLSEIFQTIRCFIYILQFRRMGYDSEDIKGMLDKLFTLYPTLPNPKDKGLEVHWGHQKKGRGGLVLVDWKEPV